MTVREDLLNEAKQYVSKDRNSTYDSPENNFGRIAAIMNAQGYRHNVRGDITGADVAMMMLAVKLARLAHSPDHKDSWVDTAGYAACGYDALLAEKHAAEEADPANQAEIERLVKLAPPAKKPERWAGERTGALPPYDFARPRLNPILADESAHPYGSGF